MKRRIKKTRPVGIPAVGTKESVQDKPRDSGRRRWLMRLAAATLVPLFLLCVVEIGLRVSGYGYSSRLFLTREIDGKDFLVPNQKFTHRFFPPSLARTQLSSRMEANKPDGTYRIFLMGESAAYGDPDPSFGLGRYLEALLEMRYPGHDFEVVNVAITAINSHVILPIARECAKHDGDMWVVYMGNNEMIGPYGAGTIFGEKAPTLRFVRAALAIKTTRLGQLMDQLVNTIRSGSTTPESWAGIDMFSKNPLRHDDDARLRSYENFKGNLDDILGVGRKAGIPIILSTVASNLKDCSPFGSLHSLSLAPERQSQWERLFETGLALENAGSFQAALDTYMKAAALDPEFAELQFRMGTCQLALKNTAPAMQALELARDYDVLAVRADTRINRIVADAIRNNEDGSVTGLDAMRELSSWSPDGIPGKELFYEHVHYTMAGNYLMARALAGKVAARLPDSITAGGGKGDDEVEFATCKDRLATTLWDEKRVWDVALGRISVAPFTSQSSHPRNVDYMKSRMREVDSRTTPDSPAQDQRIYETALEQAPDDTLIRWNYAQFFERTGRLPEAVGQGKIICELLPDASFPPYFVGSVMARMGRMTEAADYLQRALRCDSQFTPAREELEKIKRSHASAIKSDG